MVTLSIEGSGVFKKTTRFNTILFMRAYFEF